MLVEQQVQTPDHTLATVMTTSEGGHVVRTAIHQYRHARRQGGVRFVEKGSVDELAHLAVGMTQKCRAARVPLDGMKALVACANGVPESVEERADILASHIRKTIAVDPGLTYGPDMGCPEVVLDIVSETYGLTQNVTGLSRRSGGLDIDRNGLTALGLHVALKTASRAGDVAVSIQGFGAVGAHLALMLSQAGARVVAVSNRHGVVSDSNGLDILALFNYWADMGSDAPLNAAVSRGRVHFNHDPEHLLSIRTDIFVPAARTSVLALQSERAALRHENASVASVESFVANTGVSTIVEGANHPLSFAAERYCEDRDILVLPDVLVNCGGMIGCWYEHEHRGALRTGIGANETNAYNAGLAACRDLIVLRIGENCTPIIREGLSAAQARANALA